MSLLNIAIQSLAAKKAGGGEGLARQIPKPGSHVWFKKPKPGGDVVSENRQRALILTCGYGPFVVELAGLTTLDGCVVTIKLPTGSRGIPIDRLSQEPPETDFKSGDEVTWVNVDTLAQEESGTLLECVGLSGSNIMFVVRSAVPASPYTEGSDLIEIENLAKNLTLVVPSKFLRGA
jgi:hypothetical protein